MFKCMKSIYINDKRMDGFMVDGELNVPFFSTEIERQDVKGRESQAYLGKVTKGLSVSIPMLYYTNDNRASKNDLMNKIVRYIDYDEAVKVSIEGEDWYWLGYFSGDITIGYYEKTYIRFNLTLDLLDPARFSLVRNKTTAVSDIITVLNDGTADTKFLLKAIALKDSPYFFVGNDDAHILIGDDDEEKTLKNYSPTLLANEFRNKVGFSKMAVDTSITDRYLGGANGANFNQTPETWNLDQKSVTQTSGWRGGALSYTFNRSAQDFKTTFKFNVKQNELGSGKIGQFIYDENGRHIFSIGYQNTNASSDVGRLLFMAYNEHGDEKMLWRPKIPQKLKRIARLCIYMRIERIGTQIRMSWWCYDDLNGEGRHPHTIKNKEERNFIDGGNFYQRKIANVKHGIYRGNGRHRYMSLLGTYIYELLEKPKTSRDYVIKEGDEIIIDTESIDMQYNRITLNGVPMTQTFSSSFFKIKPGLTTFAISPEGSFSTEMYWRDKYK